MKFFLPLLLPLLLILPASAQTIARAEYFFDTDPGFGAGTPVFFALPGDSVMAMATLSLPATLGRGFHTLYARSEVTQPGGATTWGLAEGAPFYVQGTMAAAEYFFDTDPGLGLGTALPLASFNDSASLVTTLPAGALPAGAHTLYVRTKTADGIWSIAEGKAFYKKASIVAAEYFVDADPGLGLGTAIPVSTTSDSIALMPTIAAGTLPAGNHILHVRTKDDKGTWSLAASRPFYRVPQITAAEAFWDTDPGVGNGMAIVVGVPSDSISQTVALKVPCLPAGTHTLYVRTRDERGLWSLTDSNACQVMAPTVVASAVFPGPGPAGTPLKVSATGGQQPYTFSINSSGATPDSVFLVPNGMAVTYSATDTCGYSGSGTLTTPATPTAISAPGGVPVNKTLVFSGWRAPVYFLDASGAIMGHLNDSGQNLGAVTLRATTNTSGTVRQFGSGAFYLDRNWVVEDTSSLTTPRVLALFGTTAELNALKAQVPSIMSPADLRATKYDGSNQDLIESNNVYNSSNTAVLSPNATATVTGGFAFTVVVSSFSEFYLNGGAGTPLPLENLHFSAVPDGKNVQLRWLAGSEEEVLYYTPQHLVGSTWENIEQQQARGKPGAAYTAMDEAPLTGANHYRLQVTHASGRETFSAVVRVFVNAAGEQIKIVPNPARGFFALQGVRQPGRATLYNILGQAVLTAPLLKGNNTFSVAALPAGTYSLQLVLEDGCVLREQLVLVR